MIYYSNKEPFDFNAFKTTISFGENIYSGKITINKADQEQADSLQYILNFNNKIRPKNKDDKKIKEMFLILQKIFIRELVINAFKSELLQLKSTTRTGLKILTLKQLLQ